MGLEFGVGWGLVELLGGGACEGGWGLVELLGTVSGQPEWNPALFFSRSFSGT